MALRTIIYLVLAATFAQAEDWPRFRGPEGTGHSTAQNLPTKWSETENVVWKIPVPGKGWSSPILADGKLYLTTAVAKGDDQDDQELDRSLRALCIDAKTGAIDWDEEIFFQKSSEAPKIHQKNSHASPTPIFEDGKIYVHFGHMGTACLDPAGDISWKAQELQYPPLHGNGGCPIIVDDKLVFSCDAKENPFVAALYKETGKVAWKTPRLTDAKKKFSFSTPTLISVAGERQVVSPGSDAVCAFDPKSGNELWRATYSGYSVIPKPLYAHGLLYIVTSYDKSSVFAMTPGGKGDVTSTNVKWTIKKRAPHTPSLLIIGDELYMVSDSGIATCADARTGEIHWQERSGGKAFSASPLYADGKIYLQDEYGRGIVLRPGKKFEVIAENEIDGRTLASYAVADGALFIRSHSHLYRIGKK